jgi:hypothetical protein
LYAFVYADGAALYRAFLLREFSNENLEFWLACEEYKNSKPQKLSARAQKIYNDFVAVQATKEVCLSTTSWPTLLFSSMLSSLLFFSVVFGCFLSFFGC